jgi:putative aldouronate transport system permease protein
LALLVVVTLYPFLHVLAISLNEANDTLRGGITFYPRNFTIENYKTIMRNAALYNAFFITVLRTVVGTFGTVLITGMMAFALSKAYLKGRRFYMILCVVTMYFSGGLIPTFMVIRALNLLDSFWVYILPNLVNVWYLIIMRTYFKSLPESVEESARIDGASTFRVFFSIVLPISAPIIATIALFSGVMQWNAWFDAAIYIRNDALRPLQTVLNTLINSSRAAEEIAKAGPAAAVLSRQNVINSRSITMSTMIVTIVPIIMVYPFIQKYFAGGMMIGSIKE